MSESSANIRAPRLRAAVADVLGFLVAAYPTQRVGQFDATADVWTTVLLSVDPELLIVAARNWVAKQDRMPTVAQLRGATLELQRARRIEREGGSHERPRRDPLICPQCHTRCEWRSPDPGGVERLYCDCQWENALKYQGYVTPDWALSNRDRAARERQRAAERRELEHQEHQEEHLTTHPTTHTAATAAGQV